MDNAIEILQLCKDGEELSPQDLALVEMVLDKGLDALSRLGHERWNKLLRNLRGGTYHQSLQDQRSKLRTDLVSCTVIRTETHALATSPKVREDVARTIAAYRRVHPRLKSRVSLRRFYEIGSHVVYKRVSSALA